MIVSAGNQLVQCAWGLWCTYAHVGLHLHDLYTTKSQATREAERMLSSGWADYVVVRQVKLGSTWERWSDTPAPGSTEPRVTKRSPCRQRVASRRSR